MQCDHLINVKNIDTTMPNAPSREALASLVQHDRVHTSLYTSEELFNLELDRVFGKTWVWVAHASEIPETGSFKTTEIGTQPVIVVRGRKGAVHTLLNRCRHRAPPSANTVAAKPTALSARTTAGATRWTAACAACRTRKAMPTS